MSEISPSITSATSTTSTAFHKSQIPSESNEYLTIAQGNQETKVSGTKRTANQKEKLDLNEKKLRRLEKNRLSARACRRRKREAAQELESEIRMLESENLRLRLQLQIGEEGEESTNKEKEHLTESLDKLIQAGAAESEIKSAMDEFKEKFSDYGRTRRSAIEFHLRNIARLLMPTTTTSVAMCALKGEAVPGLLFKSENSSDELLSGQSSSYDQSCQNTTPNNNLDTANSTSSINNNTINQFDPKALFQHFVKYLDVTPEQAAALKDSRYVAKELDDTLARSLSMLQELRQRLTQCGKELETEFDSVEKILTPTQTAKFLVWISNNRACMHMLNELWSKTYDNGMAAKKEEDESS